MNYNFYGGIRLPAFKISTMDRPIKKAFIPARVILPISRGRAAQAVPTVSVGDIVKAGSKIAKPGPLISSCLHASISGHVTDISERLMHTGLKALSITIESLPEDDQELKVSLIRDVASFTRDALVDMIKEAGVAGMGGGMFPAHMKLFQTTQEPIDAVILNGAESEPYITCDHRIMLEKAKEILKGLEIIDKILNVKRSYIAIEDNKLSAVYAMERALGAAKEKGQAEGVEVVPLKTKYPQGAEQQLIKSVLNRIVPAGGLPADVGCVVYNAATAFAVYEAVYYKKPLIERVITVTGPCVKEPMNIWVRIGTTLKELTDSFVTFVSEPKMAIVGGPMRGVAQPALDAPVMKGTTGILFLREEDIDRSTESICVRCGKCVEACPMGLVPKELADKAKKGEPAALAGLGIAYCYECGLCSYICPAKIPLLEYIRSGKSAIQIS